MNIEFLWRQIFETLIIHKPSLGSLEKFGPDRFSRFDVYWIQTDRQTDKQTNGQTDKPNLYIDDKHFLID